MAWLSLVIVTLVFYLPFVGWGLGLIEKNLVVHIPVGLTTIAVSIPYTGGLRLFLYSAFSWAALWGLALLLEYVTRADLLARIGLRNDLVYAVRPPVSIQIAERLAPIVLTLVVVRMILPIILQLALSLLVPWIGAHLVPLIATRIAPEIVSLIVPYLTQWIETLIGGLNRIDFGTTLAVFSLLVVIANRAFQWEQQYRHGRDLRRHQRARRNKQNAIVIPQ
jgi:hypothetical protein